MPAIDKWLDGYFYWRGQYSIRNDECIKLSRLLYSRKKEMAEKSDDPATWFSFLGKIIADPSIYEEKYGDSALVSVEEFRELYDISILLDKKFPYSTLIFNAGRAILQHVVDGDFPPPIGCSDKHDRLTPGMRALSVYPRGKSAEGFELIALDCSAETSALLAGVRLFIEKKKNETSGSLDKKFRRNSHDVSALREEVIANGSAYRTVSDESRAIGLMLFDEVFFSGGSDANAIREIRKELAENGPKKFGKANSSERQFQRWLTNTRKCIDAADVLEI